MASAELIETLDYILNRCDEKAIEAVAQAVVRRRRELTMAGGAANLPNPRRLAEELSGSINTAATMNGLRKTVTDMARRIIKQHAPQIDDREADTFIDACIPGGNSGSGKENDLPPAVLLDMTDQFVRFSTGKMSAEEDSRLREELGSWPERYWKAFPGVIKRIVKSYLEGETNGREFRLSLQTALAMRA
jgi:hypothetical protein